MEPNEDEDAVASERATTHARWLVTDHSQELMSAVRKRYEQVARDIAYAGHHPDAEPRLRFNAGQLSALADVIEAIKSAKPAKPLHVEGR